MAADLTLGRIHRLLAAAGLVLVVVLGHVEAVDTLAGYAQVFTQEQAVPIRMTVVYVREMPLAAPPLRPAAPATRRRSPPRAPALPASAPERAPDPAQAALPTTPAASASEKTTLAVDEALLAAATAASETGVGAGVPFEWPVSTRLRYELTGYYRGEIHGQAQVEWIKAGSHYQVHLDVEAGLVAWRRMSSDGEITPEGLAPHRYDQETRIAFGDPHRTSVRFEGHQIVLANGQVAPHWPGVQDTVSQFVQLSWLFDSQPQRLRVGAVVEMPLAMPRNVSGWVYDVIEEETLYTPFGELSAFHLKPRREPRAGGDMTVDIWIAPQLRHLPVKFRIRPDPENYVDLMLDRRPELAAPDATRNR